MTPNLFLATQKVFQPHKWFRAPKTERPTRVTEYWASPEPGQYEYIPGRGWYFVAKLKEVPVPAPFTELRSLEGGPVLPAAAPRAREFEKLEKPVPVHRSRVLGRYLLEDDYKSRKKTAQIQDERGKRVQAGFFQLDDGVAWVHCWDEDGIFIPGDKGGYKLWCIDAATKDFRHMRKGDDPNFVRSRNASRNPSLERDVDARSQDSVSTAFRSGPASIRDTPSGPSTRASSIRGPMSPASTSSSRAQSRRNSPKRNNSIPLEEAKAALRRMAKEQEEAVNAAASARTRTTSSGAAPRIERGRAMTRVAN
ncbi:hypothetical protein BDU57DRAFT_54147 [Ampelomyces quisqualis]|uniref:Uncharacterized protein n=1 Tax=Ampelomyces quisqualis TaxID=50730 RepID=A0A6A5R6S3_AMPQU|nr:hypothetical protein BDU57DRAFT_54147 [Ampelomyces quisqualis]